jgi:hypothetical protein
MSEEDPIKFSANSITSAFSISAIRRQRQLRHIKPVCLFGKCPSLFGAPRVWYDRADASNPKTVDLQTGMLPIGTDTWVRLQQI